MYWVCLKSVLPIFSWVCYARSGHEFEAAAKEHGRCVKCFGVPVSTTSSNQGKTGVPGPMFIANNYLKSGQLPEVISSPDWHILSLPFYV